MYSLKVVINIALFHTLFSLTTLVSAEAILFDQRIECTSAKPRDNFDNSLNFSVSHNKVNLETMRGVVQMPIQAITADSLVAVDVRCSFPDKAWCSNVFMTYNNTLKHVTYYFLDSGPLSEGSTPIIWGNVYTCK